MENQAIYTECKKLNAIFNWLCQLNVKTE
ncbi:uncharacterized protein METZ01_LOCUS269741 [marine metagenome]|uniref:Uncharacterized protein n=1 Tax=marine metagenome TaxID=408172 RepID=A0A382K1B3_9ZZZZ